jgi:uncharacterized protein VirK/YbjX
MKLLRRSVIIAKHFFFDGSFGSNVNKHQQLSKTLGPFISAQLISAKTPLLYLRKYISTAFPVSKCLEILGHHYSFLTNNVSAANLKQLFVDGIICYAEDNYKIILYGSEDREREGSLSLYFKDNDVTIAQLSFTVSSGKAFDMEDENIVIISRFQQIYAHVEKAREAKKHFQDVMPTVLLFSVLESFCVALNIKRVIGLHGKDQLSYEDKYQQAYTANYDEFWMHNGGQKSQYGYVMNCPFPQKDLLEIKQTHRNRAKRKRDRIDAIYNLCHAEISKVVSAACTLLITMSLECAPEIALELLAI